MDVELAKDGAVNELNGDDITDRNQSYEDELDHSRQSDEDCDGQQRQHGAKVDVVRCVTVKVLVTVECDHRVHSTNSSHGR